MDAASQTGLLDTEGFDLAGRALLFFACAKKSKQKKALPTDASLRDSLRCSRARGRSFDATSLSRRNSAGSCPPSPARAALLGASQGNPVRQKRTATAKLRLLLMVPSPACGRGWSEGPGEGKLGKGALSADEPSLPAFGGTLSRKRERGTAKQLDFKKSAARRSEPVAFDVQPLAAPAGVARTVGLAATTAARASSRHGCRVEATPSTPLQPGTRSSRATNGRGLRGVLFLLTSFARAKEVRPDRRGQKPPVHSWPSAEPAP
jgi:hypothetical protein